MSAAPTSTGTTSTSTPTSTLTAARSAFSRWQFWIALVLAGLVVSGLALLLRPTGDAEAYGLGNTDLDGYAAMANVLQDHGVSIHQAGSAHDAAELMDEYDDAGVIVMLSAFQPGGGFLAELGESTAEVTWMSASPMALENVLGPDAVSAGPPIGQSAVGVADPVETGACSVGAAERAESIQAPGSALYAEAGCFAVETDDEPGYALAETPYGLAFAAPDAFTNQHITAEGNAALALGLFGAQEDLIWYTPAPADAQAEDQWQSPAELLPGWAVPLLGWLLVCAVIFMAASGRRDGPVVREPMEVTVPAGETAAGRGRLYQRANAHWAAAETLRNAHLLRLARLLRLGPASSTQDVAEAAARQTGYPGQQAVALLEAAPVSSSRELVAYAQQLGQLEDQVRAGLGLAPKYASHSEAPRTNESPGSEG